MIAADMLSINSEIFTAIQLHTTEENFDGE